MSNPASATTSPGLKTINQVVRRACKVDTHLQPRFWGEPPLRTAAWWTWKHRVAAQGLCLTGNERRLTSFKDKHKGERCFILGNGPSLNDCDLSKLDGEATFATNSIFLKSFVPTYYVVEDILVAEDRAKQIDAYRGPKQKFFGNYLRRFLGDGPDVCWMNVRINYQEYENFPHFSHDATRQLWVGGTVTYLCLQLAYHMGFTDVHMVGFDHNYTIPSDAKIDGNRIESTSNDPNHFDASYFGKGYRWHNPRVDRMEIAYERAKQHFQADNRRITNATVGGKLEVFERVNYESLFPATKRRAA
jgi:hypothetical protein